MAAIESLDGLSAIELARELRACADRMIANEPEDIVRLRARKLDTGASSPCGSIRSATA